MMRAAMVLAGVGRKMAFFFLHNLALLIPIVVLLGIAAVFAGVETIFFSLTRHELYQFKISGKRGPMLVAALRERSRSLLVLILLVNMTATILMFVLSAMLLQRVDRQAGQLTVIALSLSFVLSEAYFGELVPKIFGRRFNRLLAPLAAAPMNVLLRVTAPLLNVIERGLINPAHRLLGHKASVNLSLSELRELLLMSRDQGVIDIAENQVLQQVLWLREIRVRHVMVPRVDMVAFNIQRPISELTDLIQHGPLSKIPVYDRHIDNLLGVLYAKTFLLDEPANSAALTALLRPVHFVPELQTLDRLLADFRAKHIQLAMVVDEYGGIAGIITLEDVVEQLIGEIYEPDEPVKTPVKEIAPDEFLVSGDLSLIECGELFGDPVQAAHVSTVGGLIYAQLNRAPRPGDTVSFAHLQLTVESMRGRRVDRVKIVLRDDVAVSTSGKVAAPLSPGGPA
ncbi:MAG: hemolysin family protein [Phycisphaerae bacterium]